jgi:hypothetical protein
VSTLRRSIIARLRTVGALDVVTWIVLIAGATELAGGDVFGASRRRSGARCAISCRSSRMLERTARTAGRTRGATAPAVAA